MIIYFDVEYVRLQLRVAERFDTLWKEGNREWTS